MVTFGMRENKAIHRNVYTRVAYAHPSIANILKEMKSIFIGTLTAIDFVELSFCVRHVMQC